MLKRHLWLIMWCFYGVVIFAAEPTETEENRQKKKTSETAESKKSEEPRLMETIVVSAEKVAVPLRESVSKVTAISKTRMEREIAEDVLDLVRYEPGVSVARDAGRLGLNGFEIRGMGGNRVLTQVDGVNNGEQFSFGPLAVNQFFVDVDTLKSLEIVRGAASALYGSDALGGVVTLETKDPDDLWGASAKRVYLETKAGFDQRDEAFSFGVTTAVGKDDWEFLAHGTWRDRGERDNQGDIDAQDASRTLANPQDSRSLQGLFKVIKRQSDHARWRFTAEVFESETDTESLWSQGISRRFGVTTQIDQSLADDQQKRTRFALDYENLVADTLLLDNWDAVIYVQETDTDQRTSEVRISELPQGQSQILRRGTMDFEMRSLGGKLVGRKNWQGFGDHRLSYGGSLESQSFEQIRDRRDRDLITGEDDVYRGTLVFPTRYFPNSDVEKLGAFVQLESVLLDGRLRLVPAVRFDRFELDPEQNDRVYLDSTGTTDPPKSLEDEAVSPKFGAHFEIHPNIALSGLYAEGFRAPAFSSVNSGFTNVAGGYQTLPNPDLEAETSENLEWGLKFYGKRGGVYLTYFDQSFDEFIEDTQFIGVGPGGIAQFQAKNIGSVTIKGWEISGDVTFGKSFVGRFSFADHEGTDEVAQQPLLQIEPNKGVAGLLWRPTDRAITLELTATFAASKGANEVAPAEQPLFLSDSYQLFDLTANGKIAGGWQWNAGIFNLGDETYHRWQDVRGRRADDQVIDRYTMPGRSVRLKISRQW